MSLLSTLINFKNEKALMRTEREKNMAPLKAVQSNVVQKVYDQIVTGPQLPISVTMTPTDFSTPSVQGLAQTAYMLAEGQAKQDPKYQEAEEQRSAVFGTYYNNVHSLVKNTGDALRNEGHKHTAWLLEAYEGIKETITSLTTPAAAKALDHVPK